MSCSLRIVLGCWMAVVPLAGAVRGQTAAPTAPEVIVTTVTEDHQRLIRATVKQAGKPIENATVAFYVQRTFGNLLLGHDQTLDDGTAAVPFPEGLPGGQNGELRVIAVITEPAPYRAGRAEITLGDAVKVGPVAEAFPRSLWAPQAPWPLILTIVMVLVLVWCTYTYVVVQLCKIRKGES
jgi:hypothetical protein